MVEEDTFLQNTMKKRVSFSRTTTTTLALCFQHPRIYHKAPQFAAKCCSTSNNQENTVVHITQVLTPHELRMSTRLTFRTNDVKMQSSSAHRKQLVSAGLTSDTTPTTSSDASSLVWDGGKTQHGRKATRNQVAPAALVSRDQMYNLPPSYQ